MYILLSVYRRIQVSAVKFKTILDRGRELKQMQEEALKLDKLLTSTAGQQLEAGLQNHSDELSIRVELSSRDAAQDQVWMERYRNGQKDDSSDRHTVVGSGLC